MPSEFDLKYAGLLDSTDQYKKFISNEATALEKETTAAVKRHLVQRFQDFTLLRPDVFPKVFNHPLNNGQVITELDGVFILSADPKTKEDHLTIGINIPLQPETFHLLAERTKVLRGLKKVIAAQQPSTSANKLVIIEAKHRVTKDKIDLKLNQMKAIKQYLDWAKNPPQGTLPKFNKNVEQFKFDKYDSDVLLFIGGVLWDDDAIAHINALFVGEPSLVNSLGIIQSNGSRFGIYDVFNNFSAESSSQAGGKKTTTRRKSSKRASAS